MKSFAAALALLAGLAGVAQAADKSAEPIPRFVSLRADIVNLRTGPGGRYPIADVYKKKGYPLEIIGEFEQWRHVRDFSGEEGWVHERMVNGTRNVIVQGGQRILRASADGSAAPVAKLDPGVIAHLLECDTGWCRIEVQNGSSDVKGWLARGDVWGVLAGEIVK